MIVIPDLDVPGINASTLSPEGLFQMNGTVRLQTTRTTLTSLAEAKFGKDFVNNKLKIDGSMSQDWSDLIMFGIESMALLLTFHDASNVEQRLNL